MMWDTLSSRRTAGAIEDGNQSTIMGNRLTMVDKQAAEQL